MNEATGQLTLETPVGGESQRRPSAGELLRQAREDGGLHIAALAVALKVSVKKLEALEADRLDLLPDAVFVRAMASSVCRALKIDPAPVLDQLPQTVVPRLDVDGCGRGLNTPFQAPGDVSRGSFWDQLSRPVVLAALALLVGALVLIFFPSMDHVDVPAATTSEDVVPSSAAAPATPPMQAMVQAPTEQADPARQPLATAIPAKPAPVPVAAATVQPAVGASSAMSAPVKAKVSSNGIIVFRTQGDSWVEVTDGTGAVQISRMIGVGEVVGVSGPLPLSAVVGRADVTEVQVRGKPLALDAVTKGNVAHFEVK